ncbi:MAG TPA: glycosyltransferase family 2 protein [Thermomicrobiales bacterium]
MGELSSLAESAVASYLDDPLAHPLVQRDRRLGRQSSVLAIVPHFQCEAWLGDCLDSLVRQTRPLDAIVVVDDASGSPPVAIVRAFPQVTLLASTENVGPYRLSQEVIANTGYDAYLFQDADDWSAPTRLASLLAEAERSGAEMVGCQAYRLISAEGEVVPLTYPLDVNATLETSASRHALMHPSSIVSRDLVMRLGGYATGLKFGADTEFERRASYVARIVNIPDFAYVVRNRAGSLTSSAETGLWSDSRRAVRQIQLARFRENADRVAAGAEPILTPIAVADPIPLTYVAGPRLASAAGGVWPA